jgi:hypothetical protein
MINKINKERRRSMNANPHMTQQQEPMARSPGGPKTRKQWAELNKMEVWFHPVNA